MGISLSFPFLSFFLSLLFKRTSFEEKSSNKIYKNTGEKLNYQTKFLTSLKISTFFLFPFISYYKLAPTPCTISKRNDQRQLSIVDERKKERIQLSPRKPRQIHLHLPLLDSSSEQRETEFHQTEFTLLTFPRDMIPLSVHYADPFRGKIKYSWRRKGEICSPSFLFTRGAQESINQARIERQRAVNRGRARLWPIVVDTFASNRLVTRISVAYIHAVLHPSQRREGGRMGSSLSVGNTTDINSGSVELYSRLNGGKDVELCGSRCVSIYFKELPLFVLSEKCSSRVKLMYEGEEGRRKLLSRSIFDILPLLRLILYE